MIRGSTLRKFTLGLSKAWIGLSKVGGAVEGATE